MNHQTCHAEFRAALLNYAPAPAPAPGNGFGPLGSNVNLVGSSSYPPSDDARVIAECLVLQTVQAAGGVVPEPLWHGAIGVLAHTIKANAACHNISKGDPRYDPTETQDYINRAKLHGPTTCERLDFLSGGACAACLHNGKVKSPITLGTDRSGGQAGPSAPPAPPAPPPAVLSAGNGIMSLPRQLPAAQAVQVMNQHLGFAHDWGGKSTHFRIDGAQRVHPSSPHEMKEALASLSIVAADGTRKPAYPIWNSSPDRREVAEVRFDPAGSVTTGSGQPMLNLWRGFNRKARRGLCKRMLGHLRHVVCGGNREHFRYLLAWMAHLVQRPWEAPGVVVVLRSAAEGSGKSSVGVWLAELMGDHALVMAEPTQLLSKFNAHLETRCLVVLNELQWAGDKDAASKFKSIVTDPYLTVERKHGGVYSVPNILHIMAATNADWAVPAGHGARRWFVLDVDQGRIRDHAYFDALRREANNGGIEALMYILQRVKQVGVNLRAVPVTEALREQQERSLSLEAQWALDLADRGGLWFNGTVESRNLYNDYTSYAQARRVRPLSSNTLGRYLTRLKVPLEHTSTGGRRSMPSADAFAARVRKEAGIHA